jgi:signal peptidase II
MGGRAGVTPSRLGWLTALVTLALDQASKLFLLFGLALPVREPVVLAPFAELIVVWNRGISYGMFQQNTDLGRWALLAVSLIASVALAVWMTRAGSRLLACALGLIVGGAIGNAIDRVAYGAVFDFLHLHAGTWSWYVFNVADAAIVAGVAGLLYDSLPERRRAAPQQPADRGRGRPHPGEAAIPSPETGLNPRDSKE